ncbi:MAG: replication initiation protein, partial [Schwartzia sp.]|nr:replication initiation protein [Schwartzia sp. (in: firmicutes)]
MEADQLNLDLEILPDETHERVTKTKSFALAKYSENMSVMQNRLYTQAIAQVGAHDDPEINQDYNVDIRKMADVIGMRPDNLKKGLKTAARTLIDVAPTVYFENEEGWGTFSIFESITAPKGSPYIYKIRFTQRMRRIMIEMRKKYEIIYSPDTIMHFKNKYTSKLYDFLLAQMTCLKPNGAYFSIETTPDELMAALQYDTESKRIGSFNRDALLPACHDINDYSEIFIQGGEPKPKRLRRAIISYTFIVNYKPGREIPLVAMNNLDEGQCFYRLSDVPNDEFLREVMEDMGVAES